MLPVSPAITESALNNILTIATRQNESIEAVSARLGRELDNSYVSEVRDGVAIIPVVGPLFRYANLFTAISGASSYEILAKDFMAALDNPEITGIVMDIDSPGGEVNGCAEFASMIFEARGKSQSLPMFRVMLHPEPTGLLQPVKKSLYPKHRC